MRRSACAATLGIAVSMSLLSGTAGGGVVPVCGNGSVELGEDCDDGNTAAGDCCSPTCQNVPEGSACTIPLSVCPSGRCDADGFCVFAPREDCRTAHKSLLLFKKHATDDSKDKLTWKWIKGDATTFEDFGEPVATTIYELCIYAGTSSLIVDAQTQGGSAWSPNTKGYKYSDPTGWPSGIQKVLLKSGAAGQAKALVKGKGTNLPSGGMSPPGLALPVTAQLVAHDAACFEATYEEADVLINDGSHFKAKATQ